MRFMVTVFSAFLARQKPVSIMAKPMCMNITTIAAKRSQITPLLGMQARRANCMPRFRWHDSQIARILSKTALNLFWPPTKIDVVRSPAAQEVRSERAFHRKFPRFRPLQLFHSSGGGGQKKSRIWTSCRSCRRKNCANGGAISEGAAPKMLHRLSSFPILNAKRKRGRLGAEASLALRVRMAM